MRTFIITVLLGIGAGVAAYAQNVGINATGTNPDASAMLDVSSTNSGLLIPRVALTARNAATPVTTPAMSLLVYNTATAGTAPNNVTPGFYYWNGSAWIALLASAGTTGGWNLTGNSGTDATVNFLGTSDDKAVLFKSNNANYAQMGSRQTLGLVDVYPDYNDGTEKVTLFNSSIQFEAPAANFYKPKFFTDANGNFRMKGSSAGTDLFEFGSTGTNNGGGLDFIIGDDGDEPIVFKSYNYQVGTSEIMRLQNMNMAIGSSTFDGTNPEKLLVNMGATNSVNAVYAKGTINNYLQFNIQNQSAGANASSDIVATANNGSETTNYIDMGINSSVYTGNVMGGANDAYLYNMGQDLLIGAGSASSGVSILTGGTNQATNERVRIDGTGNVGIGVAAPTAKLDVAGTVKLGTAGSVLNNILRTTLAVTDNANLAAGGTRTATVTGVTGATINASTILNPRAALATGITVAWVRVSAANTVQICFVNTGTANAKIGSVTFDVTFIQ
jgi:hypothetical protein